MGRITTRCMNRGKTSEEARLREIAEIAEDQLSRHVDLPKSPQVMLRGERVSVKEIPFSPQGIAKHCENTGKVPYRGENEHREKRYIYHSVDQPVGVTRYTWLPEEERVGIKGRTWGTNPEIAKSVIRALKRDHENLHEGRAGGSSDFDGVRRLIR